MKKYIFIGILALLATVSCGKKDGSKNGAKDKVQVTYVKDELSSDRLAKYTEYVRISEVPNSDEWLMLFDGIDEGKFKNAKGEVLTNLKGNDAVENIKSSVKLLGNQIRDLGDVMQKNPKFEVIDTNAENLLKSLVDEQKVLNEIDDYFEKGEYKADNLGRVKELNDKFKLVSQTRKENDKILANSLQEMSVSINKKLSEKFKKNNKKFKSNLLDFVTAINKFSEGAFSKNNLNYDENEIENLEKLNEEVKKSYRNLETMTLDDARKENVNKENYEKIKKNAKMMTESIENMIKSIKAKNIEATVKNASNILGGKTDLENIYGTLIMKN
jgi:hypothetical protein